jgi:DNA-binding PadR family transcriptional regulator
MRSQCPNGTIYPSLVNLEQKGFIASRWDVSANNRKAKYYELTPAGKKHVHDEARLWGKDGRFA